MIKTERYSRLAVGSDGLLKVNIEGIQGAAIDDVALYEFRVELYGESVAREKPLERELSDSGGRYVISYDGTTRVNNVVKDGELYFVINKYALKPTYVYYSQYEPYETELVEDLLQRACHGKLDFTISYLNCPSDESHQITMSSMSMSSDYASKSYVDNAISEAILTAINTAY